MAATFTKIATVTVGSGGASTIDFSSIPSTYTDLCIKVSGRINDTNSWWDYYIRFNGSTANYTDRVIYGNGASTNSITDTTTGIIVRTSTTANTTNTFGSSEIYVPNYTSSNYKSVSHDAVSENNGTTAFAGLTAGLWSNTSAINQVTLIAASSLTFAQYSSATLYGIKNS